MQNNSSLLRNLKKETILITGVSGFIGHNLAKVMREKEVLAFGTGSKQLSGVGYCKYTALDLLDTNQVNSFVRDLQPTVVFHLGANVVLKRDIETAKRCFEVNLQGTLNLLEALKNSGKSVKRVIFSSTEEVYGEGPVPYREDQALFPPSPYAVSKVAAEHLCQMYHRLYAVPVVIIRLATAYGFYQPATRFIPSLILGALEGRDIPMNSGERRRDYIFINDVVEALLLAALCEAGNGEVINVGQPDSVSGGELVELILRLTKKQSRVLYGALLDREGEADDWRCDVTKAKKVLNWHPRTSLAVGLRQTIEWYKDTVRE